MAAARNGAALERSGSIARSLPRSAPGRDDPFAGGRSFHVHAAVRERLDRHVDVRHARQPFAAVDEVQSDVEAGCGQEQPGDELARRAGIDHDLAAAHVAVPADGEGERPVPAVVDVDPDVAQRLDHGAHRAVQRALVRGHGDLALGEAGECGDEPHDGARLSAVDLDAALQRPPRRHDEVVAEGARAGDGLDRDSERAERVDHPCRVLGVEGGREMARTVCQRREDQLAIGQRLGAGNGHRGVERAGRDRRAPGAAHTRRGLWGIPVDGHRVLPY